MRLEPRNYLVTHPRKVLNKGVARFSHVAGRDGYFENI